MKTGTWLALGGGAFLVVVGGPVGLGLYVHAKHEAARGRIEAALRDTDPCAAHRVRADVDSLDEDELRQKYNERDAECSRVTAEAECRALAAGIDAGHLPPLSANISADTKALAERMAAHKITPEDLTQTKANMSCDATLWPKLVAIFASTPSAWTSATPHGAFKLSDDMRTALVDAGVKPDVADALRAHAENDAGSVASKHKVDDLSDAEQSCELLDALHVTLGPKCKALEARYSAAKKREQAAQDRADKLAEQQADREDKNQSAQFVACMARCNRARSPEVVAQEQTCRESCAGDMSCIANCHVASDCEIGCLSGGN